MSLLAACQAVIAETGIGDVPTSIVGSTDRTAIQLKALAERSAKRLAGLNWEKMTTEHTITTANGTEGYALPADWDRYISETAWDATNHWPMRGSITAQLWQALKRGAVAASVRRRYRLRGGEVLINPTPTSIDTLILEYIINTPWTDSTGATYRVAATADTDITVFPEYLLELDLKWRFKHAKGLDYMEDRAESDQEIDEAFARDRPAPLLDYGLITDCTPPFYPNLPQIVV